MIGVQVQIDLSLQREESSPEALLLESRSHTRAHLHRNNSFLPTKSILIENIQCYHRYFPLGPKKSPKGQTFWQEIKKTILPKSNYEKRKAATTLYLSTNHWKKIRSWQGQSCRNSSSTTTTSHPKI